MKTFSKMSPLALALALALAYMPGVRAADANGDKKSKHEGPPPAAGEITDISKDSITIKDHDGKETKYAIHADTKYGSKKEPQKFEDLAKTDHVLITYAKEGDVLIAHVIREVPAHGHGNVADMKKGDAPK
jgi:hypothetical protein